MFSKMSMRAKLMATFIFVGTTPLLISNGISYYVASSEIQAQAEEKAHLVSNNVKLNVENYFNFESASLLDLAENPNTHLALKWFSDPFEGEMEEDPSANPWVLTYKKELKKFYSEQFGKKYQEVNGDALQIEEVLSKLDVKAMAAQYDFIANNKHPLGEKDKLEGPERESPYGTVHKNFHPKLRDYLNRHALYDLFLVNPKGRIVYSVFKETDFATSLTKGPWANSGLAKAFKASQALSPGQVHIEDFDNYTPSYEAAASFMATPMFKEGSYVGSLIIQLPVDKISQAANSREGLGSGGESLLFGSDMKLRADTFRNKETRNVAESFKKGSSLKWDTEAIKRAERGETGEIESTSYDGVHTLSYYRPLKIHNLTWYLVVELPTEEVYASVEKLTLFSLIVTTLGLLAIALVAFLYGSSLARNVKKILSRLNLSSDKVSDASHLSASSASKLSESSTEQAASLQETMASIEEISAMVSQNAESASKTQEAVDINQKVSEEGSQSVEQMMNAIGEIKETNEEILNQMETSNREFGEIVKIITEIGEKTKVINDIVFQTKLLAFNASVEASRAGEHGKGFAVVAEEVGNLAQMSGSAAKEITDMLSDSIQRVNHIVEGTKVRVSKLVETGKEKIETGNSTALRCQDALNRITENARMVASMISEITHASKEQAQGIQEINKAIGQLDQAMQQNTSVAQSSSTLAENLNEESQLLTEAVKDLVRFVDGQQDMAEKEHLSKSEQRPKSSSSEPLFAEKWPTKSEGRKSTAAPSSKVVPIARPKVSPSPNKAEPTTGLDSQFKMAVGSGEVPSSDDPNFEDF